jgi:hypothetical protein
MNKQLIVSIDFLKEVTRVDLSNMICPICGKKDITADEQYSYTIFICESTNKIIKDNE